VTQFERPTFLAEEIERFATRLDRTYRELGFHSFFSLDLTPTIQYKEFTWKNLKRLRLQFLSLFDDGRDKLRTKTVFSYLLALLQTCDDFASAHFSRYIDENAISERVLNSVMGDSDSYITNLDVNETAKKVLEGKKPYPFQEKLSHPHKYVTLFAPCGRGKTEASLLWALTTMKHFKRHKIIYAMPTQITSNALYDRLTKVFGIPPENVGLYHGRSFIKLKDEILKTLKLEEEDCYEENDLHEELREETFKGNVFFKPITITTIDHLILSFIKGFSQADFAFGNLQNSVIIFDEVHYYETHTLQHLLSLFKLLHKMEIPHLIMSGTLPDFLLKKLPAPYLNVEDEEGLKFRPFTLKLEENQLLNNDECEAEILANYQKGLTQFIIVNTVERAKEFYLSLKRHLQTSLGEDDINIMLYHSQFTYGDRLKKEREMRERLKKKPFVLVATQVIEISLDISSDLMYTELSPPDALAQRGGRLNRGGRVWHNSIVHQLKVFLPEDSLPYEEDLLERAIHTVKERQKPLSYREIKEMCDAVYENYDLVPSQDLPELFFKTSVFGHHWTSIATVDEEGIRFKVRPDNFQYVDVIPGDLVERMGDEAFRAENLVKVPRYRLLQSKDREDGLFYLHAITRGNKQRYFWVCNYPYSYEIGFDYSQEKKISTIL
jgi:CRISPR-associated endonuclease/helicase Cas3